MRAERRHARDTSLNVDNPCRVWYAYNKEYPARLLPAPPHLGKGPGGDHRRQEREGGSMDAMLTLDLHASNLRDHGWTELSNREMALRLYRELRNRFPELRMLGGIGYYGFEEILYLPRYVPALRERLDEERGKLLTRLAGVNMALQMLPEE